MENVVRKSYQMENFSRGQIPGFDQTPLGVQTFRPPRPSTNRGVFGILYRIANGRGVVKIGSRLLWLSVEKSNIEKLNTEIRTNVFNISGTKIEQLPKNFHVNTLVVDSKVAKNLSLTTLNQCNELVIDGRRYYEQNGSDYNFCSVNSENKEFACV